MPATVTLGSTVLATQLAVDDQFVILASTSGVFPGMCLYVADGGGHGELMKVLSLGVNSQVKVLRGVDGTRNVPHSPATVVWIGNADQFYARNPGGEPMDAVLVSPWINVRAGSVWFAQGDAVPVSGTQPVTPRWWQQQSNTFDVGALGVRTTAQNPTSST